jgi:hypothetical protein
MRGGSMSSRPSTVRSPSPPLPNDVSGLRSARPATFHTWDRGWIPCGVRIRRQPAVGAGLTEGAGCTGLALTACPFVGRTGSVLDAMGAGGASGGGAPVSSRGA